MDNTDTNIVDEIKGMAVYPSGKQADRRNNILHIANKALAGDIYFTTYEDYIKWIRNALIVTGANNNNGNKQ